MDVLDPLLCQVTIRHSIDAFGQFGTFSATRDRARKSRAKLCLSFVGARGIAEAR
jgi:hypothetical protein